MSHDSNHNLEKGPFVYKLYISLYKQISLANFLLFNAAVCMAFLRFAWLFFLK